MHGKNKEYYLAGCVIFPMVQELWNTNQHSPTAPDLRSWLSAQTEPKALSSGGLSPQEGTWECISANKAAGWRESSVQFEGMSLAQKLCPVSDKAASSGDHAVVIKLCVAPWRTWADLSGGQSSVLHEHITSDRTGMRISLQFSLHRDCSSFFAALPCYSTVSLQILKHFARQTACEATWSQTSKVIVLFPGRNTVIHCFKCNTLTVN